MNNIYKIKYFIIVFLALGILAGCSEDFLETKPATSVSKTDVYDTPETARAVLVAIYREWRQFHSMNQSGLHCLALVADCMGPDFWVIRSWYSSEISYSAYTMTSGTVRYPWEMMYQSINNINDLLANLGDVVGSQAEIDKVKGEALAMRGFCYFELIRRYQHTYGIAASQPGIPIYTEPTTAETVGNPRSPVSDVYSQILSDLNQAKGLISSDRDHKGYFNIDVVNAILARVYLTMEDWDNAISHAQTARQDYPLMSAEDWQGGFNDVNNDEWIWGQNNNAEEHPDWGSATNTLDPDDSEYSITTATSLMNSYSATDVRGQLIITGTDGNHWNYKHAMAVPRYSGDYPLIRSAEMYLIEAEAMVKSSSYTDSDAQDALYMVQLRADPAAVKSTNTGQDLIDEILLEKRKEFWGEGIMFFDMLRNELPLVRDDDHPFILSIPANSWEFIFQIPESEFLINKNMDLATDQNPATGIYTGK